ncbi:MAG: MAPEG family protein [Hyphomicrobiales bacterium]
MSLQAVLLPLFVQVALTFGLLLWLAPLRWRALASKQVRPSDIALGQKAWPERVQQIANCFQNQVELPILYYVLVILAVMARKGDLFFVILSWVFVASRLLHAFIHTGSNIVRLRGAAYGVGLVVLMAMWIIFAARVMAG